MSRLAKILDERKNSSSSGFEKYSAIIANFSQVLMLVVVVWGYLYTVLPVFQKEKLTEDLARLEIEKSRWEQEIENYAKNIQRNQAELSLLESDKYELENSLTRIRSEKEQGERELELLAGREKISREKLKTTADALADAENQLYEQQRLRLLGKTPISIEFVFLLNKARNTFSIFERDSASTVADGLASAFIQPIEFVDKKLDKLQEQANSVSSEIYRNVQLRLIDEFKAGIQRNASVLQCPEPNFQSWEAEFGGALSLGNEMVESCIDFHFKVRAEEEDWSQREISSLQSSEFWNEQRGIYSRSCSIAIDYKIRDLYRKRWIHVNKPCEERLREMSSIALEPEPILSLTPFRDMSPPSESYIRSEVQALIDGWDKRTN
ncbi:hypothetical protein NRL14_19340 [Pseudoalteromonas sp. 20-92]|uniref:hypothetical protein n=1 Tax=Pseudoalteromonas sp. 20-92 TaxID=2969394 RepID=UPI0027B48FE2|nr:hypothetical protein [Pseudoalteromonas sp. 20-92]MDQ2045861.1 hypothetical protein [Pseudoalteromonas sp. 20-92]